MSINITPQITAAYEAYLNEVIDSDMHGREILRRQTPPFSSGFYLGVIDFAAGFQSGQRAVLGSTEPQDTSNDPPFQF